MLADAYTASFYVAKEVVQIEWRDPAWHGHATALHGMMVMCGSWGFHVGLALAIVFGAFLVVCQSHLNEELTAGVVLSCVLS